jgi:hypothetical protein
MVGEILLTNDPTENRRKLAPLELVFSALLAPATLLGLEVGDTPRDRVESRSAMGAVLVPTLLYRKSLWKVMTWCRVYSRSVQRRNVEL